MNLFRGKQTKIGFTLIEIMIVISIIGILAAVVTVNVRESSAGSRDAKRQADLRNLQTALETYKNKNGRYPAGCVAGGASDGWSGQLGTNYACTNNTGQYIVGLAPEYISVLPVDPKLNGVNSGYLYRTNAEGTVYKIKAFRTVESEIVTYLHPLKACDIRVSSQPNGSLSSGSKDREVIGWCGRVHPGSSLPRSCKAYDASEEWDKSYALWGGFLAKRGGVDTCAPGVTPNCIPSIVQDTTNIICK